jgi:hypothetical protein
MVAAVSVLEWYVTGAEALVALHRLLSDAKVERATGTLPVPMTSAVDPAVTDMVTPSVFGVPAVTEATSE